MDVLAAPQDAGLIYNLHESRCLVRFLLEAFILLWRCTEVVLAASTKLPRGRWFTEFRSSFQCIPFHSLLPDYVLNAYTALGRASLPMAIRSLSLAWERVSMSTIPYRERPSARFLTMRARST